MNSPNLSKTLAPDNAPGIERAFPTTIEEGSYAIEQIDGTLPAFIHGTCYMNGPARFERDGLQYRNWLDGDGMVCALRIEDGQAHFTNRFVRSDKFIEEERLGKAVYRCFGTKFPGDRLVRRLATASPQNVSVYWYRDKLLAFGEQSLPKEIHPRTLETVGTFDFGSQLNEISPFSAHPKIDQRTGELFNFGISFSATQPCLNFYRFDQQGRLKARKRIPLDNPCSLHDFALSPNYAIFYLSPYLLDIGRMMRDGLATIDALSWQPELGSQLLILDRRGGQELARIAMDARYSLHTINSFEKGDRLHLDLIEFERPVYDQYQIVPNLFASVPEGGPVRLVVDVPRCQIVEKSQIPYRWSPDFPALDPRSQSREYDDCWMLAISATGRPGRKFFDRLVHVKWSRPDQLDLFDAPEGCYLGGEPVFVPNTEDARESVVICELFDSTRLTTNFLVFRAFDVAAGPLAKLGLNNPIHLGFHTTFCPSEDYTGDG